MMRNLNYKFFSLTCICVVLAAIWASESIAYETFDSGCKDCHSNFKDNYHNPHITMVGSNCNRCHVSIGDDPETGLTGNRGCVGCHGRSEDAGNDSQPGGLGAGLRQHHYNAGETECSFCHSDANPSNYTPVGEDVFPPFYSVEALAPCTDQLDNDGDDTYDEFDSDCTHNVYGYISGPAIEGVTIGIYTVDCGFTEPIAEILTDENGLYQYGGLENGIYLVGANDTGYSFGPLYWVDIPQTEIQSFDFTATAE